MRKFCFIISVVLMLSLASCGESKPKQVDPELVEAYYVYANQLLEKNDIDTAIDTLQDGIEDTGSEKLKKLLEKAQELAAQTTATVKKTIPTALPVTTTTAPTTTTTKPSKSRTTTTQAVSTTVKESTGGLVGTFIANDESQFSKNFTPTLYLYADSTFRFRVNLGDKMGTAKGSFVVKDKILTMLIMEHDYEGYSGDNIMVVTFKIRKKKNQLIYDSDPIGMIGKGVVLEKKTEEENKKQRSE
jgi:hypothetical protein